MTTALIISFLGSLLVATAKFKPGTIVIFFSVERVYEDKWFTWLEKMIT